VASPRPACSSPPSAPGWALALDGITYGVGALFVASIRTHRAAATERSRFLNDLSEGWREFRSRSWLCVTIVQFALINAYAIGAFLVLGPFVVRNLRRIERSVPMPTRPSAEAPRFLAPSPAAGSPAPPA
jgi:hypothetical protein